MLRCADKIENSDIIWSLVVYDVVPQLLYLRLVDDDVLTICFSG